MGPEDAICIIENTNYTNFRTKAMELFRFQSQNCRPFQLFQQLIGYEVPQGDLLPEWIPFLPVSLFKTQEILCVGQKAETLFYSSSTTGKGASRHPVAYTRVYETSYRNAFRHFYGDPSEWCILALLPSYLEREGSSLIHMVQDLIRISQDPDSGFFLYEHDALHRLLEQKITQGKKTLLLGVSFALLDFAEKYSLPASGLTVMETGGMKGRKKEMIRSDLHAILCERLGVKRIHSEYGMTELLSQAYSDGEGRFRCPPWMKVIVRDQNDPFSKDRVGKRGRLCVIDLANAFSCSFIETEDMGIVYEDGSFEVLGRLDHSDMRGCNVMVAH